jgi:hypothetical protein
VVKVCCKNLFLFKWVLPIAYCGSKGFTIAKTRAQVLCKGPVMGESEVRSKEQSPKKAGCAQTVLASHSFGKKLMRCEK